ncbi:MAG: hypothetical protein EBY83_05120, partial [Verrucomicrobia bacterium]|nr:hypothetical protein [Verrucomicrobiota bacterium]
MPCLINSTAKADKNWDGDGSAGNFDWWNNWYGDSDPYAGWGFGTGSLNFNYQNNASATGLYNNLGWKDIDNIYWNSTYGRAMTLSGAAGSGISFKQKLENLSSYTQTVTMDLSGGKSGATAIELNPVNGNLTMSGNLYNDFSNDYLVYGTTGKTLTLNTTLGVGATAANVDFSVKQASNVQVNSNQTYGGTTAVEAGSFKTGASVTLASSGIVVSGGTFETTSADVVVNTGTVNLSAGEYKLGGNDTVASLTVSGGLLSTANSSTLTAATYALSGGTVSANLGAGTATASSGTTSLSGTSAATVVNVTGGTLNTSGANKLADGAAVSVSSGTLGVGGSDTVGSLAASGTGVVTVASGTTLTANGNSSIAGSSRATGGTVAIANNSKLTLANSSTTTTSDLSIGSGSTLAGTGGTSGQIKGSGLLSPGNSPGILTSGSVDLSGGIDFAFEFTAAGAPTYSQATNSKNDLLHLTSGSTPFSGSFSAGNTVSLYFNDAGLSASLLSVTPTTYLGGFFVDSTFNIAGLLSTASMQYFIAAAGGTTSFNGVNYNLMSNEVASRMILSNVNQSAADFTTGTVSGTVLGVMAVPEPSSGSLLLAG